MGNGARSQAIETSPVPTLPPPLKFIYSRCGHAHYSGRRNRKQSVHKAEDFSAYYDLSIILYFLVQTVPTLNDSNGRTKGGNNSGTVPALDVRDWAMPCYKGVWLASLTAADDERPVTHAWHPLLGNEHNLLGVGIAEHGSCTCLAQS
ncbi:hypothetical protein BaRGS_00036040 [Batillaria attramentaria]|uniref:Uncharacterized protein n=1 Tax=Batillaria attramentaria TaxID=370345 RepID=A0ABD0JCQ8_9CAEN